MKLIPFEKFSLETNLSEEEVLSRVSDFMKPDDFFKFRMFSFNEPEKSYEGKINGRAFRMNRIVSGKNKVIPIIIGEIQNESGKTKISLIIKLTTLNLIILCLICALAFLHTAELFFFFLFIYFLNTYSFNSESLKAKIDLMKLLEARPLNA